MKVIGFSALIRHSIACPFILTSSCLNDKGRPAAILICSLTRSMPVIASVMGCST